MTRNILVTGGAGFIGANFVYHWLTHQSQDRIVVLDALTYAGNKATLQPLIEQQRIDFYQLNINDYEQVLALLQKHQINTIVNFAAESHVDRSITGPDSFIETNINGTHCLLKAAKTYWLEQTHQAHRFHHISTDEVYGSLTPDAPAFTEHHPYLPNSPYAASKAASDHLVRAYRETYGLSTSISNCSNNFGPYHFPEKLIPLTITNILHDRPIPIYGDGKQIRDWLHVSDHCRAIEAILLADCSGETFNVGGNNEQFNIDIVLRICHLMNERLQDRARQQTYPTAKCAIASNAQALITHVEDRLGHDRRYAVNASKLAKALNVSPEQDFDQLLASTVDWYLDNPSWWQALLP